MPYVGFAFTKRALQSLEGLPPKVRKQIAKRAREALSVEPQKKLPLLLVEALLVAMYAHGDELDEMDSAAVASAYKAMRAHPSFVESARYAVTSSDNVRNRLNAAVEAFKG